MPPFEHRSSTPQAEREAARPAGGATLARPPLLDSGDLLRGHAAVEISHNGVLYRLQATRLGKLILTK
ncbi:MAG TPA: hemin uptake protein HemP [Ramlibacter sp.]|nr:hemin uptake protein HemP [Ramlibacter sp.]